jgi:uncharacterized protein (TIGR03083 family)
VEHAERVAEIERQSAALRAAAISAGPDAAVPTCPEWTVGTLVRHVAGAQSMATWAVSSPPGGGFPSEIPQAPADWTAALAWWDEVRGNLLTRLAADDPDRPCWAFPGSGESTVAFWSRRQAHETAIHRLDAEYAAGAGDELRYAPEFAADGVDEYLITLLPALLLRFPRPLERDATVLWHAADTERAWLIEVRDGQCAVRAIPDADRAADLTVRGDACALYRKVWGRPTTAVLTGDESVLAALRPH